MCKFRLPPRNKRWKMAGRMAASTSSRSTRRCTERSTAGGVDFRLRTSTAGFTSAKPGLRGDAGSWRSTDCCAPRELLLLYEQNAIIAVGLVGHYFSNCGRAAAKHSFHGLLQACSLGLHAVLYFFD